MASEKDLIRLVNINKVFRMGSVQVHALNDINLVIRPREMLAIIGVSGSGKSTLMNILGFLDKPSSGKYYFDDDDASQLNDNQLAVMRNKRIGFVFQNYNLLPRSTAAANVELPLIYSGVSRKHTRVAEALARVGLATRTKHKPTELSGGEQQRVAIARALVNNPSIILADEPTGNLDSASTAEIMAIFKKLNEEGITIVLVTHEMDVAAQAQRTVRMLDGKIISDVKNSPPPDAAASYKERK